MTSHDHVIDPHDLDVNAVIDADERPADPDDDVDVPVPLDLAAEVPIEDALEQHQPVRLDDDHDG